MRSVIIRLACCIAGILTSLTVTAQSWPSIPAADLAKLKPSDFNNNELDLPYYLHHFHKVANSVLETGPNKGFINISVWRGQSNHHSYNARIMEGILSLVYFYTEKRPWNIYYGMPALKLRIEAAMEFWCRIQNKDGRFSEYGPKEWNLAATAFATKFMGESLVLLNNGPAIDKNILAKVKEADRKAIMITLTSDSLYRQAKNYSNQFTNVFAGALAYLSIYPDQLMRKHLMIRLKQSAADLQSPAGFFYERGGTDFGYNFNTHHSNLWMAYHYSRGSALAKYFIDDEKRFYEWIKYNAVPEPAGYFTTNRAIEMRQRAPVVGSYFTWSPMGEMVPGIRAYETAREEKVKQLANTRKELEKNWPVVPDLKTGEFSSFSPYTFLHRRHYVWNPTEAQKKSAFNQLPFIAKEKFIHQKMDSRKPTVFTYVKQPAYYATFNSGPLLHEQQRYGLGLIWHPKAGSIFQSQTGSDTAAWGTRSVNGKLYEADSLLVVFRINDILITPVPGSQDLTMGELTASYSLGKNNGIKRINFTQDRIKVMVNHPGNFTEHIPLLLLKEDKINSSTPGLVKLEKMKGTVSFRFNKDLKTEIIETNLISGDQRVVVLLIHANNMLNYDIGF